LEEVDDPNKPKDNDIILLEPFLVFPMPFDAPAIQSFDSVPQISLSFINGKGYGESDSSYDEGLDQAKESICGALRRMLNELARFARRFHSTLVNSRYEFLRLIEMSNPYMRLSKDLMGWGAEESVGKVIESVSGRGSGVSATRRLISRLGAIAEGPFAYLGLLTAFKGFSSDLAAADTALKSGDLIDAVAAYGRAGSSAVVAVAGMASFPGIGEIGAIRPSFSSFGKKLGKGANTLALGSLAIIVAEHWAENRSVYGSINLIEEFMDDQLVLLHSITENMNIISNAMEFLDCP